MRLSVLLRNVDLVDRLEIEIRTDALRFRPTPEPIKWAVSQSAASKSVLFTPTE
jgi:hypothetical protein